MKKITLLLLMTFYSLVGYCQFPNVQDFEGLEYPFGLPPGWMIADNGVGTLQSWRLINIPPPYVIGTQSMYINQENIGAGNTSRDYLITSPVLVPPNGQLRFFAHQNQSGNQGTIYEVRYSTNPDQSNLGAYQLLKSWTEPEMNVVFSEFEEKVVDLTPAVTAGQTIYLAFVRVFTQETDALGGDRWIIDDVNVVEKCLNPNNLEAQDVAATSAKLIWQWGAPGTPPSSLPGFQYQILLATDPIPSTFTPTNVTDAGPLSQVAQGLEPDTDYKYYLRAVCNSAMGIYSEWVGPFYFSTIPLGAVCSDPVVITDLPYQTFANTGSFGNSIAGPQGAGCGANPASTNFLSGNDAIYRLDVPLDAPEGSIISITLTPNGTRSSVFVYAECSNIGVSCLAGVANTNGDPRIITNFPVVAGEDYYIVVSSNATTPTIPYNLIIQYENCEKPTGLGFNNPTLTGGNFTWTEAGTATSWQVAVQNAGETIPSGDGQYTDTDGVAGMSIDLPADMQGVPLQYWVRSECAPGVYSAWAGPFLFNTLLCNASDQCTYTFRMTDSANNGWNGARMQIRQNGVVLPNSTGELTIGGNYNSGAGPVDVTVSLCPNIPFDIFWITPGTQPQQCILTIINNFGQTIHTIPAGSGIPGEVIYLSQPVNCSVPQCDIPPTNVTISDITTNGATINWNAPGTEGMGYHIYLVPTGDPAPSNGEDEISQGVYTYTGVNGAAAPFFHTISGGLIADQSYDVYVRIICQPRHSLWTPVKTFITLPTCPKPINPLVTASSITQTGATLTWTNGTATDDKWEILLVPGTSMTPPTGTPPLNPLPGDGLLYNVDGPLTPTSYTVNNLTAATIYYYYIRTVCPGDDKSTWSGPVVFHTITCDEADKCEYKFYPTNTSGNSWNNARMQVRQNGIILTPQIGASLINSANPVIVKLCPGVPFDLFWSVEGTAPANIGITIQNPFLDVIYTKAPGQGAVGDILFSGITNCDDAPCAKPTDIAVSNVGPTSVQITWTDNSDGGSQSFDLYVVETGGPAPVNNPATTPTHTGVQSGYILSTFNGQPLNPSTSYTFYVRAVCSDTETSTWTILTPTTFITTPLNDLCVNATPVTVNTGQVCVEANTAKGNIYGSTFSPVNTATPITGAACGVTSQDVWYSFVATSTSHTIMISNVVSTPSTANVNLNHSVFSGTCDNMQLIYCSNALISGAPNLIIGNTYYVRVYKSSNNPAQSATFDLCIVSPPANDECANSITVTPNSGQNCNAENIVSSGTFASSSATIELDPDSSQLIPANLCAENNDDVWFNFVATSSNHTIIVSNVVSTPSNANVKLNYALFSGTCGNLNLIFCSNTYTTPTSGLVVGQTYYIRVYKATTNAVQSATFDLCIISPPVNDECANALPVTVNPEQFCQSPNTVSGNTIGSTASNPVSTPPLTGTGCGAANRDIWYSFVATATSNMISFSNIVVTPSTATTVRLNHSVFSGTCDGLNRLYCSTDEVSMATGLIPGNTYYVRIYTSTNNNDHSISFDMCITSPPANDECPNSIAVTPNSGQVCDPANMAHGSTLGASASLPILNPPLAGAGCLPNNNDIWYHFVATHASHAINLYNVNVSPATSTARLNYGVFSGPCDNLTKLYCSTTNYSNATGLIPGETYYIRIYSTSTSVVQSISFDLCITSPPVNDECSNAIVVPVNDDFSCSQRIYGSTVGATQSSPTITGTGCTGTNDDVWYKFTAGPGGIHFINVNSLGGNSIDVALSHSVFSGTCDGTLTVLYCSTQSSSTAMNLTPGQDYYIRVYTAGVAVGDYVNFNLCVKTPPPPAENEDCATAMPIQANAGGSCVTFGSGNLIEAGPSGVPNTCQGNADDDVWFSFTALTNQHFVNIFNVEGTTQNLNHAVYSGNCNSLSLLYCSAANSLSSTNTGFVPGQTYYVRVWSNTNTPQIVAFDICIKGTSTCETAEPFCVSETVPMIFPNSTQVPNAGQVACLFQTPNPTYYYLQVQSSGNLVFNIRQSTDPNNFPAAGAPGLDVDFVAWGPFDSPEACDEIVLGPCNPTSACINNTNPASNYPFGNVVDCSYDAAVTENFYIDNAVAGQYYLLLLTNFSQQPGYIKLSQSNYNQPGAGQSTNLCCVVDLGPDIVTCQPSVTLDAVENPATAPQENSYVWYFNNGIIPNETSSTYIATQTGVYRAVGVCGLNSASDEIYVEFLPAIESVQPADYLVCDDATNDGEATFNLQTITAASVGVDGLLYTISIHETEANALVPVSPINVTVPYESESKTLYIRIQSNSVTDCYAIQPLNLVVNVLESSEFEYDNSHYCTSGTNPLPVFDDGVAGNFTSIPAGLSINPQTGEINLAASAEGVYSVTNSLNSNGACNPDPTSFTVTITAQKSGQFIYSSNEYCNSGTALPIFENNGVAGIFTVEPAGLSINATTGEINLSNSSFGTYTITNTIVAVGGCDEDVQEFTITVTEATTASISYNSPFCQSLEDIQNVNITGNTTGSFSASPVGLSINATTGAIDPSLSTPGTYTVNYFVPAQGSCDEINAPASVTILAGTTYEFIHGCDGAYKLSVLPVNGSFDLTTASFVWSGGTPVANEPNTIVVREAGDYSVTITTEDGCITVTDFVSLSSIGCQIQRGISPNGDGKNDSFDLSAYNVGELNIYNRYGTEVYHFRDYVDQWYGQSNSGKELPDGTYFYVIHTREGDKITGWIYINR